MEIKKILAGGLLVVTVSFVGYQVYCVEKKRHGLETSFFEKEREYQMFEQENRVLQSQIDYYAEDRNLEKELRGKFNYRAPDETMIIVVPQQEGEQN
ncbi:MAG: hypothetical protein V1652_02935 [bacterium]